MIWRRTQRERFRRRPRPATPSPAQIVQALVFGVAQHEPVRAVPQHEGFRDRLDRFAQPLVGGCGDFRLALAVGDVERDADQPAATAHAVLDDGRALAKPHPFAIARRAAGIRGRPRPRRARSAASTRPASGLSSGWTRSSISSRVRSRARREIEDFEHRARPGDQAAVEVPVPQAAAAARQRELHWRRRAVLLGEAPRQRDCRLCSVTAPPSARPTAAVSASTSRARRRQARQRRRAGDRRPPAGRGTSEIAHRRQRPRPEGSTLSGPALSARMASGAAAPSNSASVGRRADAGLARHDRAIGVGERHALVGRAGDRLATAFAQNFRGRSGGGAPSAKSSSRASSRRRGRAPIRACSSSRPVRDRDDRRMKAEEPRPAPSPPRSRRRGARRIPLRGDVAATPACGAARKPGLGRANATYCLPRANASSASPQIRQEHVRGNRHSPQSRA